MGAKKSLTRVVLDSNVLISALLFAGRLEPLRQAWRTGRIRPVLSKEIADEVVRVLAYPKFRLTKEEITALLETELLPYVEVVGVPEDDRAWCRDPADDKFIRCALASRCRYLVSGDEDLRALRDVEGVRIVAPAEFIDLSEK